MEMSFFKEMIQASVIWHKGLTIFSSDKLKRKNWKKWKWCTELKPGTIIDGFCRRFNKWTICKIVEQFDKDLPSNVIIARFYADFDCKCRCKSRLQVMNRYTNIKIKTMILICVNFCVCILLDLVMSLLHLEHILNKKW